MVFLIVGNYVIFEKIGDAGIFDNYNSDLDYHNPTTQKFVPRYFFILKP